MAAQRDIDTAGLAARVQALPGVAAVREAADGAGLDAYLVGGSVRDALLGHQRADLDVVTDGDHLALARALGDQIRVHDRFGTATVITPTGPVDVARARAETYPGPGALPEIRNAGIAEDLARRDFTVNALALALHEPGIPIDPHGGIADLGVGLLRVLHPGSFVDDPTRALRAARYAARLGLEVEPVTLESLRAADLRTVSADRVDAELRRLAAEQVPRTGFERLAEWGLMPLRDGAGELIDAVVALLDAEPWSRVAPRADSVLAAARGDLGPARELAAATPATPASAVEAARGRTGVELALGRALGANWLDPYVREWRHVRPQITGGDLIAAGVEEGPPIGRGLSAALRAKLDGEAPTRDDELRIALEAARS